MVGNFFRVFVQAIHSYSLIYFELKITFPNDVTIYDFNASFNFKLVLYILILEKAFIVDLKGYFSHEEISTNTANCGENIFE